MRICDFSGELYNGCYWYRNRIPQKKLKERGHKIKTHLGNRTGINTNDQDLFLMARGYDGNYNEIAFVMQASGVPVVYDIDDAMDLVTPTNVFYQPTVKAMPSYFYLLNIASLVTTTTEALAKHLQTFAPNAKIKILPNCVDPEEWTARKGSDPKELRIGFAGSPTHIEDILVVMEAVRMLRHLWRKDHDKPKITLVIFGFSIYGDTPETWMEKNRKILAKSPHHPFMIALNNFEFLYKQVKDCIEWHPSFPVELYPYMLAKLNLDIGCAPLKMDEFNRYKSSIKMYEYAMVGTFGVCSYWGSFQEDNFPNAISNKPEDWMKNFERYVTDPAWRVAVMQGQKEFVLKKRTIDLWMDEREKTYKELLPKNKW